MNKFIYSLILVLILYVIKLPCYSATMHIRSNFKSKPIINQKNTPQKKYKKPVPFFNQSSYSIGAIDPMPNTNPQGRKYPGFRGANQLIVYTPRFGIRTNTNEYGIEAIVVNGIVMKFTGADTIIPRNGFVISGHGNAKNWIKKNLMVGAKIQLDYSTNRITSMIDSESYIFAASQKIDEVQTIIRQQKIKNPRYEAGKAYKYLAKAKKSILKAQKIENDSEKTKKYANNSLYYANNSLLYAIPYKQDEFKGVWLRPTEKNRRQIASTLDNIKKAGIDNVFVETYYHGTTIFPSRTLKKYGIKEQKAEFKGIDPLRIWIEEAHKRRIKVHAWVQAFYIGNENPVSNPKNVLNLYPQWANIQKQNYSAEKPMPSGAEHNGYFLDPANPDVRVYIKEIISEIVTRYQIDGINVDYVRYPVSLAKNFDNYELSNWGYTDIARCEFKEMYDIDPIELKKTDELWPSWEKYRQGKVTEFIASLNFLKNDKVELSAVIFPNKEHVKETKMQDWQNWGNYLNSVTPLVMSSDETALQTDINKVRGSIGAANIYPGLFETYTEGSYFNLLKQINASRNVGAKGVVLFDYAHLKEEYVNALKARIFRK